jgi:copper chaperone
MATAEIKIEGMSCSGCVSSVTRSLKAVPGVEGVDVSLDEASAKVTYDAALTGVPELKRAVERAGFDAP